MPCPTLMIHAECECTDGQSWGKHHKVTEIDHEWKNEVLHINVMAECPDCKCSISFPVANLYRHDPEIESALND